MSYHVRSTARRPIVLVSAHANRINPPRNVILCANAVDSRSINNDGTRHSIFNRDPQPRNCFKTVGRVKIFFHKLSTVRVTLFDEPVTDATHPRNTDAVDAKSHTRAPFISIIAIALLYEYLT